VISKGAINLTTMGLEFIEGKTFNKIDFTQNPLIKGEYESCNFISCDFSTPTLQMLYLWNVNLKIAT
jgi:hypothetical protein